MGETFDFCFNNNTSIPFFNDSGTKIMIQLKFDNNEVFHGIKLRF